VKATLAVRALPDLAGWDGLTPLEVRPTAALLDRPDRLFARLGTTPVPLVLGVPEASEPCTLPRLFAWLVDAVRWQRLGLLGAGVAVSSALPACLGAPLGLARHVRRGARSSGASLPCTACAAGERGCEGVPAGVLAAYASRDELRRDLARLVRTPPLDSLDGAWLQYELGLRSVVRAMDDGAGPLGAPLGLATAAVDVPLIDRAGGRLVPDATSTRRIVYAGRDRAQVEQLAALETRLLAGDAPIDEVHARLGLAFGYPPCCVQAFVDDNRAYEKRAGATWGTNPVHLDRIAARSAAADPLLNPFLRAPRALRLIEHLPCRFDCPASHELARVVARELIRRAPALAPVLPELLGTVALVLPDRDEVLFVGRRLSATRATLTRVVQPGGLAGPALAEADELELRAGPRVALLAEGRTLTEIDVAPEALAPGLPRLVAFDGGLP